MRTRGTFDKDLATVRVVAHVDTNLSFSIPSRLLDDLGWAFNVAIVEYSCSDMFDIQVVPTNDIRNWLRTLVPADPICFCLAF